MYQTNMSKKISQKYEETARVLELVRDELRCKELAQISTGKRKKTYTRLRSTLREWRKAYRINMP